MCVKFYLFLFSHLLYSYNPVARISPLAFAPWSPNLKPKGEVLAKRLIFLAQCFLVTETVFPEVDVFRCRLVLITCPVESNCEPRFCNLAFIPGYRFGYDFVTVYFPLVSGVSRTLNDLYTLYFSAQVKIKGN